MASWYAGHAQMNQILKTMLEQIAQLKVYLSLAEKGYSIAENGLHVIRDIKHGEFTLHSDYFSSLEKVKPAVADMDAVNGVISLETSIISKGQLLLEVARSSAWLLPPEVDYITHLVNTITQDSRKDVDALTALTTDNTLSISDGDRVAFIQALYEDVQKQDAVISGYSVQVKQLIASRAHDASTLDNLKKLYGL
jgi:hypothetical protein